MALFSRREKRKTQIVNVDIEINRIAKFMWEYEGKIETIVAEKIFIAEADYNAISKGINKVISEVVEEQGQGLDKTEIFKAIVKGQNLVSRIIDKLYDIDWNY